MRSSTFLDVGFPSNGVFEGHGPLRVLGTLLEIAVTFVDAEDA